MTTLAKVFSAMFTSSAVDSETARRQEIDREWDRQRARALGPADRAEIDAIFSRII